jgi:two-component sensor histidine kinase
MSPLEFEGRMLAADGSVRWVRSISRPSPRPDGAIVWDGFAFDVTEQRRAEDDLRARTAELRVIMDTVPAIIWLAHDREARRITGSRYAAERLRLPPETEQSLSAGEGRRPSNFRVRKNGRELSPDELPVQRAAMGEEIRGEELEVVFDDGTSFWELVNASPVRDARGEVVGAVGAAIDVSERKRAEEQQKLLMAELDHRVKNTLATVQSIVRLTAGDAPQAEVLSGRIRALATAHNLLAQSRWRGADLRGLLKEELRPYRKGSGERPRLRGPAVALAPKAAQALSLVVHELATNAAKYGALSTPEGSLDIGWQILQDDGRRLVLVWQERGGPPVIPPARSGFGLQLIRSTLAHDMGGSSELRFDPEGLVCRIELGLEHGAGGVAAQDAGEGGMADEEARPDALAGRRILVVEDEYLVAMEVERMVAAAGCRVVGPSGGLKDALGMALSEPLDGAVIDINLGGESVAPLAELLRQRNVPFVFMTGYGRLDMLPAHQREATVLRKPVRESELLQALAGALARGAGRPGAAAP